MIDIFHINLTMIFCLRIEIMLLWLSLLDLTKLVIEESTSEVWTSAGGVGSHVGR